MDSRDLLTAKLEPYLGMALLIASFIVEPFLCMALPLVSFKAVFIYGSSVGQF
jgi:hypothetical protein